MRCSEDMACTLTAKVFSLMPPTGRTYSTHNKCSTFGICTHRMYRHNRICTQVRTVHLGSVHNIHTHRMYSIHHHTQNWHHSRHYYSGTTSYVRTHWDQLICPLQRGCSLFRGEKCISTIGMFIFGALESVLCREVVYMLSLFRGSLSRGTTVHKLLSVPFQ